MKTKHAAVVVVMSYMNYVHACFPTGLNIITNVEDKPFCCVCDHSIPNNNNNNITNNYFFFTLKSNM